MALCQLTVGENKQQNLTTATTAIKVSAVPLAVCLLQVVHLRCQKSHGAALTAGLGMQEAARHGASLIVLPEMWNCPYSNDSFPIYAEDIDGGKSESALAMSQVSMPSMDVAA